MKVIVTGGAGFIGSAVVRALVSGGDDVVTVDALTYAGSRSNLAMLEAAPNHLLVEADICDEPAMHELFGVHQPDAVMHLAAESHVDRSIDGPAAFVRTNVEGTRVLLDAARRIDEQRPTNRVRFHHVSTDEVFGSLGDEGAFDRESPYDPRSPYSASKAASDHLVRAWHHTFGLDAVISNCSNNYGPHQHPEKLIPHMILSALAGRPLPVYGTGGNVRDWLHVDDHAAALIEVMRYGVAGSTYLVGGRAERTNLQVVESICGILDQLRPSPQPYAEQITFVTDRPGHDHRYAIDASDTEAELRWTPAHTFEEGLAETVRWYLDNEVWWQALLAERELTRIGLAPETTP